MDTHSTPKRAASKGVIDAVNAAGKLRRTKKNCPAQARVFVHINAYEDVENDDKFFENSISTKLGDPVLMTVPFTFDQLRNACREKFSTDVFGGSTACFDHLGYFIGVVSAETKAPSRRKKQLHEIIVLPADFSYDKTEDLKVVIMKPSSEQKPSSGHKALAGYRITVLKNGIHYDGHHMAELMDGKAYTKSNHGTVRMGDYQVPIIPKYDNNILREGDVLNRVNVSAAIH